MTTNDGYVGEGFKPSRIITNIRRGDPLGRPNYIPNTKHQITNKSQIPITKWPKRGKWRRGSIQDRLRSY